jgi:hypothetical protein
MGDQDRPTFLPPEDPDEPEAPCEPDEADEAEELRKPRERPPPEPVPVARARPARRGRLIALVTAGVLVLGAALAWANGLTGHNHRAEPRGFARLTDVCPMVPASSVEPLGPSSVGRPNLPPGGSTLRAEVYAGCRWTGGQGIWTGRGPREQRRLSVSVRVSLPRDGTSGHAATRLLYAAALTGARDMAAKHIRLDSGITEYWPVRALPRVGDAAYGQYEINRSGTSVVGLGRAVARLRNALITVEYSGVDYPADRHGFADRSKATPLNSEKAQRGAADVATTLTYGLAACTTCKN